MGVGAATRAEGRHGPILLATFLGLAAVALAGGILPGDVWLRDLLLAQASARWIIVMRWVNYIGNWRILLPGTLLLFLFPRARRRWWIWAALMLAAPSLDYLFKPLIGRLRPEGAGFGFPSGHATATAAYIGALMHVAADLPPLVRRFFCATAATLVVLVGLARIVLRAHWPSDVLGGIALGLACVAGAAILSSYMDGPRAESASPVPPSQTCS